jgi:hypothetical protein
VGGAGNGIYNDGAGELRLTGCAIVSNSVTAAVARGAGILSVGANSLLFMTNCTVSRNTITPSSSGGGAGVYFIGGATGSIFSCTISSNRINGGNLASSSLRGGGILVTTANALTLGNSIVAANLITNTANGTTSSSIFGTISNAGFNITGGDPLLGPLQNNGGTTPTHALLAGSPAIDAGYSFGAVRDQRGFVRPADTLTLTNALGGDGSDIGAFETAVTIPVGTSVYTGNGDGSFGGAIGTGSLTLSNNATTLFGTVWKGTNGFWDVLVLYLDTGAAGFLDTAGFGDAADGLRKAISGYDGGNRSLLTFSNASVTFSPKYAVALGPSSDSFGGLWQLANGGNNSLSFISSVNLTPTGTATSPAYSFSLNLGQIGVSPTNGASVKLLGTYISNSGYRSLEALPGNVQGVSGAGWTPFNTTAYSRYFLMALSPTVTTATASSVSATAATLNGSVNPNGLPATAWFQWGTNVISENTSSAMNLGNGSAALSISAPISNLTAGAVYHFRAVGSNSAGITYGGEVVFHTLPSFIAAPRDLLLPPNAEFRKLYYGDFLFYASGVAIRTVRQKLFTHSVIPPALGATVTNDFNSSVEMTISFDGGQTFRPAYANVSASLSLHHESDSGGTRLFSVEMLTWNCVGGDLPPGVQLRESPLQSSLGTIIVEPMPDGTFRMQGYLDIFVELTTDGGQYWQPPNGAMRLNLGTISSENPFTTPDLPPLTGAYTDADSYSAAYASGVILRNFTLNNFNQAVPPPAPANVQTQSFTGQANFELSTDGGNFFIPVTASASGNLRVASLQDDGNTRYFDTEMLQLDVFGGTLPAGVQIRESPARSSLGRTSIRTRGIADYQIDSFFMVATDSTRNNGQTWEPSVISPMTLALQQRNVRLRVEHTSTNTIVVAWPAPSTGFSLEQKTNLVTANWTSVTNPVSIVGSENQVIIPLSAGNRFYRLRNP